LDALPRLRPFKARYGAAGIHWCAALLVVSLTFCDCIAAEPPDSTPERGAIEKTGDFPDATPLKKPAVLWKYTTKLGDGDKLAGGNAKKLVGGNPDSGIGVSDPVYYDGVVYFGDNRGTVHAVRARDGLRLWETTLQQRIFHAPFVDASGVYCTSEPHGVWALNRRDGTRRWPAAVQRPGAPLKAGRMLFVAGGDGIVYAFNAESGAVQWERNVLDELADPPRFDGRRARFQDAPARPSNCASDGETLYQSIFDQCRVVAIDCETGRERWSFQTGGWIHGNATMTEEFVLVGSQDEHCYCLDKRTGEMRWKFPTGSRIESGPAVRGDSAYIPSCDGTLYRIDLKTGKAVWRFRTTPDRPGETAIYSAPLLLRDSVCFAAGEGQLYAVEIERGELLWRIRPSENSEMYSSPATDGRRIFVQVRAAAGGQGENAIIAIDESTEP
jgi:outer membrane protein assembly factor BamB